MSIYVQSTFASRRRGHVQTLNFVNNTNVDIWPRKIMAVYTGLPTAAAAVVPAATATQVDTKSRKDILPWFNLFHNSHLDSISTCLRLSTADPKHNTLEVNLDTSTQFVRVCKQNDTAPTFHLECFTCSLQKRKRFLQFSVKEYSVLQWNKIPWPPQRCDSVTSLKIWKQSHTRLVRCAIHAGSKSVKCMAWWTPCDHITFSR